MFRATKRFSYHRRGALVDIVDLPVTGIAAAKIDKGQQQPVTVGSR
jgi:hypothetical protein